MSEKSRATTGSTISVWNGGYSLVEMAIAMVVVGLLIAPTADVYSNYLKQQKRQTTLENVQNVLTAIQSYRTANGVFPCPSGLNVPRGALTYGSAVNCTSTGPIAVNPATGNCDLTPTSPTYGICVEQTQRADATGLAFSAFQKRVLVGGVPFRQMQIPEKQTYDGYGNRLVYVMTQSMGDLSTLSSLNGGITIQDPTGKSLTKPDDSAVFAVYSTGPDGVGGWTMEGAVHIPCTGAVGADVANCNLGFEGGAGTATAILVDGYESSPKDANHYDDYMMYFQSQPDPLWRVVTGTTNIQDLTDKSVGIGVTTPTAGVQLDVAAAITAPVLSDGSANTDSLIVYGYNAGAYNGNQGKALTDQICDANGANCFDPIHIGGTAPPPGSYAIGDPGMVCPTGTYMAGVDGATVNVSGGADCYPIPRTCPTGQVMNGITAGNPNCVTVPDTCAATDMGVCSTSVHLNTVIQGTVQPSSPATVNGALGGCRQVQWTCQAGGTWLQTTDVNPSYCSFTTTCTPVACTCTTLHNSNFSNTAPSTCTKQSCTNCGGGSTISVVTDNCVCKSPTTTTQACPSPWTGGTRTRQTTYSGANCTATIGAWDQTGCTCSRPATQVTTISCPANTNSGTATRTCPLNPSTCTYLTGASCTDDYSACVCVPPNPTTRTIPASCPAGGSGTQNQTFDTTSCTWVNSGTVMGCTCPANYTETQACVAPALGNRTRTHTYGAAPSCTETISAWNTSGCTCPANGTQTQACPIPPWGSGTEFRTVTYGAAPTCSITYGSWNTSGCSCPGNYTETASCSSPFTGGTQTRTHTFGAGPTCTETIGSWDTSGCACSLPATETQTLGCGTGYNSGQITQTRNLIPATCTYGSWSTTGNTCACVTQPDLTDTRSCSSPWTGTETATQSFVNNPGVQCGYSGTWSAYTGCTCDTSPQPYSQPHDCSPNPPYGTDCYDPNPGDPDTGTISNVAGPGTCTPGTPVITHQGTCNLKAFTWVNPNPTGNIVNPKPGSANYIGSGCSCGQHRASVGGTQGTCYSTDPFNFNQFTCDCQ